MSTKHVILPRVVVNRWTDSTKARGERPSGWRYPRDRSLRVAGAGGRSVRLEEGEEVAVMERDRTGGGPRTAREASWRTTPSGTAYGGRFTAAPGDRTMRKRRRCRAAIRAPHDRREPDATR